MRGRTERLRIHLGKDLESLLAGCAGGDRRAWRRLLESVRQLSLELAQQTYQMTAEDAEDLAQLVQIRVSERLPQIRRPEAFPLWVRRVVHHLAVDMLRQHRPTLSLDDPLEAGRHHDALQESVEHYNHALLRADLERALARLPDRYRDPIRLHVLHGMPQDDISQLLGRPRSTIATQIERGLERLRRSLAGLLSEGFVGMAAP